jgi:hypothetical protein
MSTPEGDKLVLLIETRLGELQDLCEGLDDKTASRAPEGRWSPKQILSHILGPEGKGMMATIKPFLEQDVPLINVEPEDPFFTGARAQMPLGQLLTEVELEYVRIALFVARLSKEQLNRKAHIPIMKDTASGEYPTLAAWVEGIVDYHLGFHINHMKEVLQALAHL